MNEIKSYTAYWNKDMPFGSSYSEFFEISMPYRNGKLKLINIDAYMFNTTDTLTAPEQIAQGVRHYLVIGPNINETPFASHFKNFVGNLAPLHTGKQIVLSKSGNYLFDDFWFREVLKFNLQFINGAAAKAFLINYSLLVQIEETER